MNEQELDEFTEKHLLCAFPKWTPNDYWTTFWGEKLKEVNFNDAKRALNAYAETKHFNDPDWPKFKEFLGKVTAGTAKEQGKSKCMYFLIQCFASHTPCEIGQYKPIAWDVKSVSGGDDILKRCSDDRKIYCWKLREDGVDGMVRDAAIMTCGKLSVGSAIIWRPALNKSFGEVRDCFLACREYFKSRKIKLDVEMVRQMSINDIMDDEDVKSEWFGNTSAGVSVEVDEVIF